MGLFRAAGYSSSIKSVPTSDGYCRADLHVVGAHLMGKDDLVVDVTVRHDFIGDARDVPVSYTHLTLPTILRV